MIRSTIKGDVESSLIETSNVRVAGVLKMEECNIDGCEFYDIAFLGPPNDVREFRQKLTITPKPTK